VLEELVLTVVDRDDRFVQMIKNSVNLRNSIRGEKMLPLDFYPRESNLFTTREPTSFFNLYHTECQNDQLIDYHLRELARKIVCVCQALEEDTPIVRYGHRDPTRRDADGQAIQQYDNGVSRLAKRLAIMVQQELDRAEEERYRNGVQPPERKGRPQGVLFIVDRTLDLFAPLLHEFTYQAMAHDLLPIKDGEEVSYNVEITTAEGTTERKDMPLTDGDKLWVRNRHMHMKDTIEKLMEDFQSFLAANKNFTGNKEQQNTSLHAIRDMMATLPEFQKQKDEYSLHLTMAQECMGRFEKLKLPDVALLEQVPWNTRLPTTQPTTQRSPPLTPRSLSPPVTTSKARTSNAQLPTSSVSSMTPLSVPKNAFA
jgi:syntaxin-binding protein 1